MIETVVARTFAARNAAHLAHFATESYAQHKALDGFYSGIVGAVDALVEAYQGQYGRIGPVVVAPASYSDILGTLIADLEFLISERTATCRGSTSLENLFDALIEQYQSTLYMLTLK